MKCKKTLSGKHFWETIINSWKNGNTNGVNWVGPKDYYRQCKACGMVDSKIRKSI